MTATLSTDIKFLMVCASVLYVKFLISAMVQGRKGFHAGSRCPEDNKLVMARGMPEQTIYSNAVSVPEELKRAYEDEERWKRIVRNDLESIPLALVLFLVAIAAGGDQTATSVLLVVYTAARLAHTVAYAYEQQLHRMLAWMLSVVCILGAAINGAMAVYRS